jgi:hypothetical protein
MDGSTIKIIFDRFSKNAKITNFMSTRPVGAELFCAEGRTDGQTDSHTEGQTHMTKLIVAFRNFVERALKICLHS